MTTDLTQFVAGGGGTLYQQTFTSSGTWTKPSSVSVCWISASGGGGGGSGSSSRLGGYQGAYTENGGGGNAGYWILDMPLVVTGNLTITIGGGGAGAYGAATATAGGATSVTHGGVVVINCDGGNGGLGTDRPALQTDYGNLWGGGQGGKGYYYLYSGGSASIAATRIHRTVGSTPRGAGGGSNPFGNGGNGASNGNGGAGGGNGGGGGGAAKSSQQSGYTLHRYTGGAGSGGIVIVKWIA